MKFKALGTQVIKNIEGNSLSVTPQVIYDLTSDNLVGNGDSICLRGLVEGNARGTIVLELFDKNGDLAYTKKLRPRGSIGTAHSGRFGLLLWMKNSTHPDTPQLFDTLGPVTVNPSHERESEVSFVVDETLFSTGKIVLTCSGSFEYEFVVQAIDNGYSATINNFTDILAGSGMFSYSMPFEIIP